MTFLDIARIALYRFHEKGLEVFLINSDIENDPDVWKLPECHKADLDQKYQEHELIELIDDQGQRLVAIEGDWHNIPSIRGLLKHDIKVAKSLIKENIPGIEKGTFFAVKELVKKTLPDEYSMIKELKDILIDRNTVKNL